VQVRKLPIVDNAVYVDGKRAVTPDNLDSTYEAMRDRHGMAWIGLYRPEEEEINSVAAEFGLHRLAVEDAIAAHQRPKLEQYGDQLFVVFRPARYIDETEKVEFGELHVFLGPDFVVTIRHAESPELSAVRSRLEADPDLLTLGTEAVMYAILDQVVDEYEPVVEGLQNDIDEIEDQLFSGDPSVSRRIYTLSREVAEFQRATEPLVSMIDALKRGNNEYELDVELKRSLRDVLDHCVRITERVEGFKATLQNALQTHATLVAQQQNEEMRAMTQVSLDQTEQTKKISSWGAILFAPSLIAAIYGMNFEDMPELKWHLGYPMAILGMVVLSSVLYLVFKRQKWL
jgi:magnesium transporter